MALLSGTRLGPYEIEAPLGAGGMGEVYRARDTRLDRTVAVKILPPHLAGNPEARQRFEREARAISSLNHPHICTLHDIGNEDGAAFLVMEYVPGETLDARLQKGPLPLRQALEYGIQICDALEKAHRAGIVHRDLKPGNIMLAASGAKLLDFGLAKPVAGLGATGTLTPSTPTMNLSTLVSPAGPLTQQGSIVGTFQFMAPEVLQGHEADARSDIFSFGCVLYQMITGRRAFEGKSQISVASAILEKEPEPVSKLAPLAPATLDHVVNDCLAKDPESRWQSAADVGRELRWIAAGASTGLPHAAATKPHSPWRERLLWMAALAAMLGILAWSALRPQQPRRVMRSYLPPPTGAGFDLTGDFSGPPAVPPDGSMVAFCARGQGERNSIWVQSLSELSAHKLDGTEGASFPFFSPDGKFIGFFAGGQMKKVASAGGPVSVIADAPNSRGGTWNADNVIVYEPDYRDSLWRIPATGGTPVRLTKLDSARHTTHRWPWFLPDGKHFLFFGTNHAGSSEQGVYFGSLEDGSYHHVVDSDSGAQYASGYLLYHVQSALLAQKFDPASGKISGDAVPVASPVEYDPGTWHTTFAASQNGLLIYESGSKILGIDLVWRDRAGKTLGNVADRAAYKGSGRLSPDGKLLAISMGDPQADIWVFDLERGARTRLTFGGATFNTPSWSPDGKRLVYVRQSGANLATGTSLCERLANGGGQEKILMEATPEAPTLLSPQWSPDSRYLLHIEQSGPGGAGVWALPTFGDRKPIPIVRTTPQVRLMQFRLSPDGHWLAYSSTESGREEIYVTRFPSGEGRWQISQNGGTFPVWSGDGREIFFAGLQDAFFHSVGVRPEGEGFQSDPVRNLFQFGYISPFGVPFEAAADGQRFILSTLPESISSPLALVTNWSDDLKK
jgi:Tol biopolymer transport system component